MKLYFIFKEEIANCSSRPPISVIKISKLPPRRNPCRARHFFDPQPDDGDGAFSCADSAIVIVSAGGAAGLERCLKKSCICGTFQISDRCATPCF